MGEEPTGEARVSATGTDDQEKTPELVQEYDERSRGEIQRNPVASQKEAHPRCS